MDLWLKADFYQQLETLATVVIFSYLSGMLTIRILGLGSMI